LRIAVFFDGWRVFTFFGAVMQDKNFSRFDRSIMKSIHSFSALSRKDKLAAKELQLNIVKVTRRHRSVGSAAKKASLNHHAEDQIRLLNGIFPTGEPKLGDLIKIVR